MQVAVLGFGTVGRSVYEMLADAPGLTPGPVLVRRGKEEAPFKLSDMAQLLAQPDVDAVAEALVGVEPAYAYVTAALNAGKHVVTANKALVAAHGPELAALAREKGVGFLFSAACGGGVPFLQNLALAARSDRVTAIGGILNGTTNFMLDAMQRKQLDYAQALSEAQQLGYAEADPTADVSGLDSLRKIMLACAVAYGVLPEKGLHWEGITDFTAADAAHIRHLGLCCRLLASGGQTANGALHAYVEPALLPQSAPECAVMDNYNLARYVGACAGPMVLIGQGAGGKPTASGVLRDLCALQAGVHQILPADCRRGEADNETAVHPYYARMSAALAGCFPAEQTSVTGSVARMITRPVSVSWMHETVAQLRREGERIFFAAMA